MSCQNTLCWYELVPLASFFVLGGRCRTCKTRISISYPLVELATGLIFAALFLKFSALGGQFSFFTPAFIIAYAYYAAIFALLVVIAVYDLRHKIIPDSLAFALGALGFIGLFFFNNSGLSSASAGWAQAGFYPHMPSILEFLSGFLIVFRNLDGAGGCQTGSRLGMAAWARARILRPCGRFLAWGHCRSFSCCFF